MITKLEKTLLCSFEDDTDIDGLPIYVQQLWNGDWESVVFSYLKKINSKENMKSWNQIFENKFEENYCNILAIGIASLCAFCEANWTGPSSTSAQSIYEGISECYNVKDVISAHTEDVYSTVICPELLYIAIDIFDRMSTNDAVLGYWWKMRAYYLYQRIIDEKSPHIYSILEGIVDRLSNLELHLDENPHLKLLLYVEIGQVHLLYGRVQNTEDCLQKANSVSGLNLSLKGALGKRTKFQQHALAQLTLDVTVTNSSFRILPSTTHGSNCLLNLLKLNDDVRLDNIQYLDIKHNTSDDLTSLEQQICLATVQCLQRSQPKDELADEELFPYINLLLSQKDGPWSTRIISLLLKCKLESNNKRTIERSMMQCEEVVNAFSNTLPKASSRLSYLWASGLIPVVEWRSLLADLLLNLGLVKAALDIYLQIQQWEDVVACYTILELRHKAAEIIQQQIDIKPTVKLYCLLGDATDDVLQYEIAWNFSNQRSSRAQRHWGNFLFSRKKYDECISHYQKSCEINSLQESVWLRLGYASMTTKNWELAATAYRRYTFLEPHSFEAWNNLAKVYVKQGNKMRAYKALSEALKYNYDNWQVWENMLIVSLDTGHFDDVVRSYHRILDIRNKHLDLEVLTLLLKAVMQDSIDADGNSLKRIIPKILELFGRISSVHPNDTELWRLYADISPTALLRGQRLLKAYKCISQSENWLNDTALCEKVLLLVESLAECSMKSVTEVDAGNAVGSNQMWQLLSSARLTTQAVVRSITAQKYDQFDERVAKLEELLKDITSELQKR